MKAGEMRGDRWFTAGLTAHPSCEGFLGCTVDIGRSRRLSLSDRTVSPLGGSPPRLRSVPSGFAGLQRSGGDRAGLPEPCRAFPAGPFFAGGAAGRCLLSGEKQ